MKILPATLSDAPALADLFLGHIQAHPAYISHGELQMGVGEVYDQDGSLGTRPAPDAREKWMKYITAHLENPTEAHVWKAVSADGTLLGFAVADIEEDGDAPFGMVCDLLVKEGFRGLGTGARLLQTAIAWLRGQGVKDIYLESGKDNHAAHLFFQKRGFVHMSEIYKLQ